LDNEGQLQGWSDCGIYTSMILPGVFCKVDFALWPIRGAHSCMAAALSRCPFDEVVLLLSNWKALRFDP
jgi:hypothetical protein